MYGGAECCMQGASLQWKDYCSVLIAKIILRTGRPLSPLLLQSPLFTCIMTMAQAWTIICLIGTSPDWTWTLAAQPKRTASAARIISRPSPSIFQLKAVLVIYFSVGFNEDLLLVFSPLGFATNFLEIIKENEENDIMWWAEEEAIFWQTGSLRHRNIVNLQFATYYQLIFNLLCIWDILCFSILHQCVCKCHTFSAR